MKVEIIRFIKKVCYVLVGIAILLFCLVIPVGLYLYKFGVGYWSLSALSNDSNQWSNFGDYINPFISFISSIVIALLTYKLFILEKSRETPIIQAILSKNHLPQRDTLELENISDFIAFEIRVILKYECKRDEGYMSNLNPKGFYTFYIPSKEGLNEIVVEYQNGQGKIFTMIPSINPQKPYTLTISKSERRLPWFQRKVKPFKFE